MSEIVSSSSLAKKKSDGTEESIASLAAKVREMPEYQQAMNKIGKHVDIAQRCMNAVVGDNLMEISDVEQTLSMGTDDNGELVGKEEMMELVMSVLSSESIDKTLKLRLVAIFIAAYRSCGRELKRQIIQAAKLGGQDQKLLANLDSISGRMEDRGPAAAAAASSSGGFFSSIFGSGGASAVKSEVSESEYTDTRHITQLKFILNQLLRGELPPEEFPPFGPPPNVSTEAKSTGKSVRKHGTNSRWGKKDQSHFTSSSRYMVFIAGGVAYSEMRNAHEMMEKYSREVIIGGTHYITPSDYLLEVADCDSVTKLR